VLGLDTYLSVSLCKSCLPCDHFK